MVLAVLVQHVVLDEAHPLRHAALERRQFLRRERERWVANEALVVEKNRNGVVVAGDEPEHRLAVDSQLAEDRVVLAHPRKGRVGLCAEAVTVEVVLPGGGGRRRLRLRSPALLGDLLGFLDAQVRARCRLLELLASAAPPSSLRRHSPT